MPHGLRNTVGRPGNAWYGNRGTWWSVVKNARLLGSEFIEHRARHSLRRACLLVHKGHNAGHRRCARRRAAHANQRIESADDRDITLAKDIEAGDKPVAPEQR